PAVSTPTSFIRCAPLPEHSRIDHGRDTERFYAAEANVVTAIMAAATELAKIRGLDPAPAGDDFYPRAVPGALLQVLDSLVPSLAAPAAIAYLQSHGLIVSRPLLVRPAGAVPSPLEALPGAECG